MCMLFDENYLNQSIFAILKLVLGFASVCYLVGAFQRSNIILFVEHNDA